MTQRAENLRLGPIAGGPRAISTTIEYSVSSTPGTRGPSTRTVSMTPQPWGEGSEGEAPEWRTPAGAQAPGTVLPAGGTGGRPTGSVQPDSTLPAGGTAARPPGFVPPSSTLPAVNP